MVAHRGCERHERPNTVAAADLGLRLGADAVEVDVQLSRDGVPFLRHHLSLPDGRWAWEVDWAELSPGHDGLDAFLDWAGGVDAPILLDLKAGFRDTGALAAAVADRVEAARLDARAVLLSWHHDQLRRLKEARPRLATQALVRGRPVDLPALVGAARVDAVGLSYDLTRPEDVDAAHEAGVAVVLAELFRPDFARVRELRVDAVTWGDPAEARRGLDPADC